jgi:hypothetical protein
MNLLGAVEVMFWRNERIAGIPIWLVIEKMGDEDSSDGILRKLARVMKILVGDPECGQLFWENNCLDVFERVFRIASFEVKEKIGACLAELVQYVRLSFRIVFFEKNAVPILIELISSDSDRIVIESLCSFKILSEDDMMRSLDFFELTDGWTEFQSYLDRSVIISQRVIEFLTFLRAISTGTITTILP